MEGSVKGFLISRLSGCCKNF